MFSLPPRKGQRDGPDIAAAFGADRDGLPVAMRRHRQIGRKALAVRRYFNVIARRAALERAGGVAAGLGPLAGNGAAAIFHVAREVEIIAGAGASQIKMKLGAAFVDVVGRAAAQRLLLAVGQASDSRLILQALNCGADHYLADDELEAPALVIIRSAAA